MNDNVNHIDNTSQRLTLYQLVDRAHTWFRKALIASLEESGGNPLSNADLNLIANLDCGTTYTSELARRLGVSRQAVNKLLHNLITAGLVRLEQSEEQRNTKLIVMTEEGTDFIRGLVSKLNEFEDVLASRIGKEETTALRLALEADWGSPKMSRNQSESKKKQ